MKIGYARVSTKDQKLSVQVKALNEAGCHKIYKEKISGAKTERPELDRMLEEVKQGDSITVWRLDRLGRSTAHLFQIVNELHKQGIYVQSIKDGIDTRGDTGMLVMKIMAIFAEYERNVIKERVQAGVDAYIKSHNHWGRKAMLDRSKVEIARLAIAAGKTKAQAAEALGVSAVTLRRAMVRFPDHGAQS